MKKTLLVFASITSLITTAAEAQVVQGEFDPYAVIPHFNAEIITPILRQAGARATVMQSPAGETYLQVEADNGFRFNILFGACAEGGQQNCKGLSMSALWDKKVKNSNDQITRNIRKFNEKYNFMKAGVLENGSPFLQRYAIADYGALQGNVLSEIRTFITIASLFDGEALEGS